MRIVTQTATEIEVRENTLWVSVICWLAAIFLLFTGVPGHTGNLVLAGFFLAVSPVWAARSAFIFDGMRREVRWKMMRFFRTSEGSLPFGEIQDIGLESLSGGKGNSLVYRLTLLTAKGTIRLATCYAGSREHYLTIREAIRHFVQAPGEADGTEHSSSTLDTPVRFQLRQRRMIDAIRLLESNGKLTLTDARERIDAIRRDMDLAAKGVS